MAAKGRISDVRQGFRQCPLVAHSCHSLGRRIGTQSPPDADPGGLSSLRREYDADVRWRFDVVADVEQAFDVPEMTLHQFGRPGAVARGERVDQSLMLGLRTGAHAARAVEADDEGRARDELLEKLGHHRIAGGLSEMKMKLAREADRLAAVPSAFGGPVRARVGAKLRKRGRIDALRG